MTGQGTPVAHGCSTSVQGKAGREGPRGIDSFAWMVQGSTSYSWMA